MGSVLEIVRAAEHLAPEDFLKLRTELDRVEEKLWNRELRQVSAKHSKEGSSAESVGEKAGALPQAPGFSRHGSGVQRGAGE